MNRKQKAYILLEYYAASTYFAEGPLKAICDDQTVHSEQDVVCD